MRSRSHRSLGGDPGWLNRLRVSIGLDREAIIGAQPERDLDDVFGHEAPPILVRVSKRSRMACLPDSASEIVGPVEKIERGEIVWTTAIVLPSRPMADWDTCAQRRSLCRVTSPETAMPARFERRSYEPGSRPSTVARRRSRDRAQKWKQRLAASS